MNGTARAGSLSYDPKLIPLGTGELDVRRTPEQFADKLDSMARLAGGIAHEFNSLLADMLGTADLALASTDLEPSLRDDLNYIREAGHRAAAITRQLMAFSGSQALSLRPTRVNDVLRQLEPQLRQLLPPNVTLQLDFQLDAVVEADSARLEEMILGLVANAIDAMPAGGEVSVATGVAELPSHANPDVAPESHTMIVVNDAGVGLTEMARERLFEPFFTTKERGKGIGLSLASIYGTVRQMRGRVDVESAPGYGTQVRLSLPTVAITERPAALTTRTVREWNDYETLLVVEDEPSVRAPICRALRGAGYLVLEARNGEDALRVIQEHHAPIHLVISDVMMPEMHGTELVEMLRSWYPHMRVLFISGYSAEHVEARKDLVNSTSFLAKPFTMAALVERVRGLLDAAWKD